MYITPLGVGFIAGSFGALGGDGLPRARAMLMLSFIGRRRRANYLKQWLARALLLCAMSRAGVRALGRTDAITVASFSQAFPDSKAWFEKLMCKGESPTLRAFFANLKYDGRPEFFSMHACLLGNYKLWVQPKWLRKNSKALQDAMLAFAAQNGFMGVPALCVKSVQAQS